MKRSQIVVKFQATDYRGFLELLSIEKCSFVKVGAFSTIEAGGVHLLTFNAARGVHPGTIVGDARQTGIYQHLYLAFQFHRDDFGRPDASLA